MSARKARALYSCEADDDSELSFSEGDIIVDGKYYSGALIKETSEEGWYEGRLEKTGRSGLFPYNYVEMIEESPKPVPAKPKTFGSQDRAPQASSMASKFEESVPEDSKLVLPSIYKQASTAKSPSKFSSLPVQVKSRPSEKTTNDDGIDEAPKLSVKALRESFLQRASQLPDEPQKAPAFPPKVTTLPTTPQRSIGSVRDADNIAKARRLPPSSNDINSKAVSADGEEREEPRLVLPSSVRKSQVQLPDMTDSPIKSKPNVSKPALPPKPSTSIPKPTAPPSLPSGPKSISPQAQDAVRPVTQKLPPPSLPQRAKPTMEPTRNSIPSPIASTKSPAPALPPRENSISSTSSTKQSRMPPRPDKHSPFPDEDHLAQGIPDDARRRYNVVFDANHKGGLMQGSATKKIWAKSRIDAASLARVWNLADVDQDGYLNKGEFAIGMFLIDDRLGGYPIPDELPAALLPK
ncbi:hypothetical protein BZG36_02574 [Bifiguratus adelaidae]|uniref:SH3 domain-containing protein n=1 Tax=Bifiguratus adelaidae TaxID=1938954 RepID=A0A261Y1B5_9FUNG|nr:hypothetical protein BZG36_02574 [Bifiguratus adelaidae]